MSRPPARISGFKGSVRQLFKDHSGTDVGKQAQLLADAQQSALGTLAAGEIVPLGAADRAQQDGVGILAHVDGLLGQAAASSVDGAAAGQNGGAVESVAELVAHLVHNIDCLGDDIGADAVAGNDRNFIIHGP